MHYPEFWKFLADFWREKYTDKNHIDNIWGAWKALADDFNLYLTQYNISKNINVIPTFWQRLWTPIFVKDSLLELDIFNISKPIMVPLLVYDTWVSIPGGLKHIIPDSVKIFTEFKTELPLDSLDIDYWNGMVKISENSSITSGDQIFIEYSPGVTSELKDYDIIIRDSIRIYDIEENRWLKPTIDFLFDYANNTVNYLKPELGYHRVIFDFQYCDTTVDFPYKYPLLRGFYHTDFIYTNPDEEGKQYEYGKDFTLVIGDDPSVDQPYIRFKELPKPGILWAPHAYFSFDNVYRMFGVLTGYLDTNSPEYYVATYALTYFLQNPPTPKNLTGVCQAMLGIPVSLNYDTVIDIYKNDDNETIIKTVEKEYNIGKKYNPIVKINDKLQPISPLTDALFVHDPISKPDLHTMLEIDPFLFADKGWLADDGHRADSMLGINGRYRLSMTRNVFIVEINDDSILYDPNALKKLEFVLQNKPSWTTYVLLIGINLEDELKIREVCGSYFGIINSIFEDYWGQRFEGNYPPLEDKEEVLVHEVEHEDIIQYSSFEELPSYYSNSFGPNHYFYDITIDWVRLPDGTYVNYTFNEGSLEIIVPDHPNEYVHVRSTLSHTTDYGHDIHDKDGNIINPIVKKGNIKILLDDEGKGYPFYPVNTSEDIHLYTGSMRIYDGMVFTPYTYTILSVKDSDGNPVTYSYDDKVKKIYADLPDQWLYVTASEKYWDDVDVTTVQDYVPLVNGEANIFKACILEDSLSIFGHNVDDGVIHWEVSEYSDFSAISPSSSADYTATIMSPYIRGLDYLWDSYTGVFTILPEGRLLEGQYIHIQLKHIKGLYYPFDNDYVMSYVSYDPGRCRITKTDVDSIPAFFRETYLGDSVDRYDAILMDESIESPYNEPETEDKNRYLISGAEDGHNAPLLVQAYGRKFYTHGRALPDFPTRKDFDREFLKTLPTLTTEAGHENSITYLGEVGPNDFRFAYSLPLNNLFITRLSILESDTCKYREFDFLLHDDFIVDYFRKNDETWKIYFKTQLPEGEYEIWRTNPLDLPRKNGTLCEISSSTFIGEEDTEYKYKYRLPIFYNKPAKLTSVTSSNYSYGEIEYLVDKDFISDGEYLYFKTIPVFTTYFVWDYKIYIEPTKYHSNILLDDSTYKGVCSDPVFKYEYELSPKFELIVYIVNVPTPNLKYAEISLMDSFAVDYSAQTHLGTIRKQQDYTIIFDIVNRKSYIRFKTKPPNGEYEVWKAYLGPTEYINTSDSREAIKLMDSDNKFIYTIAQHYTGSGIVDEPTLIGLYSEVYEQTDWEFRLSESYIYRLSGPSVPQDVTLTMMP